MRLRACRAQESSPVVHSFFPFFLENVDLLELGWKIIIFSFFGRKDNLDRIVEIKLSCANFSQDFRLRISSNIQSSCSIYDEYKISQKYYNKGKRERIGNTKM